MASSDHNGVEEETFRGMTEERVEMMKIESVRRRLNTIMLESQL